MTPTYKTIYINGSPQTLVTYDDCNWIVCGKEMSYEEFTRRLNALESRVKPKRISIIGFFKNPLKSFVELFEIFK